MSGDSPIVQAIHRYHPDWEAPRDTGKDWIKCLCPFHGEERPSAAVSFKRGAFNCLACGVKGDVVTLIKKQEEVSYAKAQRIAEGLSSGGDRAIPEKPARQSGRRVFGDKGIDVPQRQGRGRSVHARVRGRPAPWS
ncbi:DNA primase [Mycobacterium phage Pocahontas]|uniref:DNA primase n=1 Tax=Mycobacterium phage Veracruz TaxID=2530154 RepID=A0A481VTQ4_9CAUD|nr:DNA primase [Mycobacterium phage Veracruz]AIS73731.1 DNA primase [Mycobacterium phage QuinnKiro]ALA11860.1 DNA primase [Mycobacterium phage Texage]AOT24240.1 DNA primase [Mycobacterium phage Todacoro]AWY03589.1 DNA primase [Mycobacterium phage Hookmount]AYR03470.1 DNA primase [Mycobacterium phage Popcicle]QBP32267.1 DNA primase [Mycobacterium phage Noella]QDP44953.1 DNA primase [Mycobacterium phage Pocahontas]